MTQGRPLEEKCLCCSGSQGENDPQTGTSSDLGTNPLRDPLTERHSPAEGPGSGLLTPRPLQAGSQPLLLLSFMLRLMLGGEPQGEADMSQPSGPPPGAGPSCREDLEEEEGS